MSASKKAKLSASDSRSIGLHQASQMREEVCMALRAIMMTPLMTAAHPEFALVRRHAVTLQEWFSREVGWPLQVSRDYARLYKRPSDLSDDTRGMPEYDRRRYVILCLACAVLERAEPQITLCLLGERLLALADDDALTEHGFVFTLQSQHERRELVAVCRTLIGLGVLSHVVGDEEAYIRANGSSVDHAQDALYDIRRGVLAGMLAAVRGPSTWPAGGAPLMFEERLHSLVTEYTPDNEEGRRTAQRHTLARRLLDDPVLYFAMLDEQSQAYLTNQRGPMAARLADAAGLTPEQRAEGLALVDEAGTLTDMTMPSEGTDAHVTLMVAEFIVSQHDQESHLPSSSKALVADFIAQSRATHGHYWRRSAHEPGAEHDLARVALDRLRSLQLIEMRGEMVYARPALGRFSAGPVSLIANKPQVPDHNEHTR